LDILENPPLNEDNLIIRRDNQYLSQDEIIKNLTTSLPKARTIPYFSAWLSGFIEAEGNFNIVRRKTGGIYVRRFSIGQNKDRYLIDMIKVYFESAHTLYQDKNKEHYRISIGGFYSNKCIIKHFEIYPLLGEKLISYEKWKDSFKNK
jgi:hypothetical protein